MYNWQELIKMSRGNTTPAPKITRTPRKEQEAGFKELQGRIADLSLDGLANGFMANARHKFRYIPQADRWMMWDGHVWVWDTLGELREEVKEYFREFKTMQTANAETRKEYLKIYNRYIEPKNVTSFLAHIKTDAVMRADLREFDQDVYDLNTPNGVVDLVTGEMLKPNPAWLLKRSTTVAPDAQCKTEKYDRLLSEAFAGRPELAAYFNMMMGITLINAQDVQVFMYMHGAAGSGKGTLMTIAQSILGKGENGYSQYVDSSLFVQSRTQQHPTEMMQFLGARMVVTSEITEGQKMDTGKLKKTTGGDPITGRYMGKDHVTFDPTHTLWLMANHRLKVPHDDKGVWRRLRVIPFDFPAQTTIEGLPRIIFEEEGPGILAKWIECAQQYLNNGYVTPTAVIEAGGEYIREQDTVSDWLEDCADVSDATAMTAVKAVRDSYKAWCVAEDRTPLSRNDFAQALEAKGIRDGKARLGATARGTSRVKYGITLSPTFVHNL